MDREMESLAGELQADLGVSGEGTFTVLRRWQRLGLRASLRRNPSSGYAAAMTVKSVAMIVALVGAERSSSIAVYRSRDRSLAFVCAEDR